MYYSKHPFLKVGLPFLSAVIFGTYFLSDLRSSRYEPSAKMRESGKELSEEKPVKRSIKSLEEELEEWEREHRKKIEASKGDYEMKPVTKRD